MYRIECQQLSATINPLGAELSSLLQDTEEYLWQGDASIWSGRAPILFPIVGTLANNQMNYRAKRYEMPRHGIARKATFICVDQTDSALSMQLRADSQLKEMYPWDFELTVHFSLTADTLSITYEVTNLDASTMIFTIGSHPAFRLPELDSSNSANPQELSINNYSIHFDQAESLQRIMLNDAGLLSTDSRAFSLENNAIKLSDTLFAQDALVFKNIKSQKLSLSCNQKTRLTVDTGGAPHLGIWSKPAARFVCIEPWYGTSDYANSDGSFENKPDMLSLAPQKSFKHTISVSVG